MEGYFPIHEYCRLAKISTDAAYHRTNRNKIPYFIDKENRMFIYFSDEGVVVPEGFVSCSEYGSIHERSGYYIKRLVNLGKFEKEDYVCVPPGKFNSNMRGGTYVRKDALPTSGRIESIKAYCPEGYMHLIDWCNKTGMSQGTARQYVIKNLLETIKVGKYRYIKEDTLDPRKRTR